MWSKIRAILSIIADVMIYGRDKGWWKRERIDNMEEYIDAFKTGLKWLQVDESQDQRARIMKTASLMADFEERSLGLADKTDEGASDGS